MPKAGLDRAVTGRAKGTPNKTTALLKDAILKAAEAAGNDIDGSGLEGYLKAQAITNPGPFMALLGKVLPLQILGTLNIVTQEDALSALDGLPPEQPEVERYNRSIN